MPFHITIDRRISLRQLANLKQAGHVVLKTPHVGNLDPSELAVGWLGIPLLLVDATVGEKDYIYHPHSVIRGGQQEVLGDPRTLSTSTRASHDSKLAEEFFSRGQLMTDGHLRAANQAVPGMQIETHSDWMLARAGGLRSMLEICARHEPALWTRYVGPNGIARQVPAVRGWQQIASNGIHRLDGEQGWVVPNILNILADAVFGAVDLGQDTVWSLSGLQMASYIGQHLETLNRLYEVVRQEFAVPLPEQATYVVVPVAECRFAVPASRRAALDSLVTALQGLQAHREIRSYVMQRLDPAVFANPRAAIELLELERKAISQPIAELATASGIVYNVKEARFPTQYDMLDGGGLYVTEWMLDQSVEDVTKAYRLVCNAL